MEGEQTKKKQLSSLLHANDNSNTVQKVELALAEARRRNISSSSAYLPTSYKDSDLSRSLVDYGPTTLDQNPDMRLNTYIMRHTHNRSDCREPKVTGAQMAKLPTVFGLRNRKQHKCVCWWIWGPKPE